MTQQTQNPEKKKFNPTQEALYRFGIGQEVKIVFLDGKAMTGKINQISRYHIVLEGKDELITVFKHAIKYIISKKPNIFESSNICDLIKKEH